MARLRGESAWSVVRREVLPNATSVLLVEFALRAGYAPVLIGSLGFLGFGLRPPTPEWGLMISENRALLIVSPITVLGPGLALASLVVGLNLFTEGLARMLGRTVKLVGAVSDAGVPLSGPGPEGRLPPRRCAGCGSSTASVSPSRGARCSAWSARVGCGKSTVACQLLGYRQPDSRVEGGQSLFNGQDLLRPDRRDLDRLRGNRIGFVPQNPTTALNPGIRVGAQIAEIAAPAHSARQTSPSATGRRAVRPRRPARSRASF